MEAVTTYAAVRVVADDEGARVVVDDIAVGRARHLRADEQTERRPRLVSATIPD